MNNNNWSDKWNGDNENIIKQILDISRQIPSLTTIIFDFNSPEKFITVTTKYIPDYLKYGQLNIIGLKDSKSKETIDCFLNKFKINESESTIRSNNLLDLIALNTSINLHFVDFKFKDSCDLFIRNYEQYASLKHFSELER